MNGLLLPGYRIEGQEQERPSALGRLAAAKEAVAKKSCVREVTTQLKNKTNSETL